ncbi:hypothetical protein ACC686_36590, partial [Rhizobium johnstonii]|uniref:hypothetical protein n=1 Tax=Rhizobium johnstonii TaxID=3019933 RepID=UPI003F9AF2D4
RPDLNDLSVCHDRYSGGHGQGRRLVMCNDDRSDADTPLNGTELELHAFAEIAIQSAKGLVEK